MAGDGDPLFVLVFCRLTVGREKLGRPWASGGFHSELQELAQGFVLRLGSNAGPALTRWGKLLNLSDLQCSYPQRRAL